MKFSKELTERIMSLGGNKRYEPYTNYLEHICGKSSLIQEVPQGIKEEIDKFVENLGKPIQTNVVKKEIVKEDLKKEIEDIESKEEVKDETSIPKRSKK